MTGKNRLFASMCMSTFQPGNSTRWGREWVKKDLPRTELNPLNIETKDFYNELQLRHLICHRKFDGSVPKELSRGHRHFTCCDAK